MHIGDSGADFGGRTFAGIGGEGGGGDGGAGPALENENSFCNPTIESFRLV